MRLEQQEREEEEPTILACKLSHENGSPQSPPEPLASQKSKALRVESLGPAASEEGCFFNPILKQERRQWCWSRSMHPEEGVDRGVGGVLSHKFGSNS